MVDFTSFKVPIFPGINDAPVSPTASKGGNGSDLVARFNGLTDTVEQVLSNIGNNKPVIGNEQFLYVNIANGNDTEGDGSEERPFATLTKLSSVLSSSIINKDLIIYITGDFNETLDLSKVEGIYDLSTQTYNRINIYITIIGTLHITSASQLFLPHKDKCRVYFEGDSENNGFLISAPLNFRAAELFFYRITFQPLTNGSMLIFYDSVVSFDQCVANLAPVGNLTSISLCTSFKSKVVSYRNTFSNAVGNASVYRLLESLFLAEDFSNDTNNVRWLQLRSRSVAYLFGRHKSTDVIEYTEGSTVFRHNFLKPTNLQLLTLYLDIVKVGNYSFCWRVPYSGKISHISAKPKTGTVNLRFFVNTTEVNTLTDTNYISGGYLNVFDPLGIFNEGDDLNVSILSSNEAQGLQITIGVEVG